MKKLTINQNDFKQISNWAEDVYNIAAVVNYFCINQTENEELYNLSPIIKNLKQKADLLNAFFINYN